jgi:hypothetical protein
MEFSRKKTIIQREGDDGKRGNQLGAVEKISESSHRVSFAAELPAVS